MAKSARKVKDYGSGKLAFFAVLGILLISLGVVSLLSVVGGLTGTLFDTVRVIMQGLGGSLCVGLSLILIWGGLIAVMSVGRGMPKRGFLLVCVIYLAVLAIINLQSHCGYYELMDYAVWYNNNAVKPPAVNPSGYINVITAGYALGAGSGTFGGALGMLLGWPAWNFLKPVFGTAVLVLVCLVCVIFFARFDVKGLLAGIKQSADDRAARREERLKRQEYERMIADKQREAEEAERLHLTPAYRRRGKSGAQEQAEAQSAYPPYGSMIAQPAPVAYGTQPPPMGYPPMAAQQPIAAAQPAMYDELINTQAPVPFFGKASGKPKRGSKKAEQAAGYQTKMTFTPSEMGAGTVEPEVAEALSGAKRLGGTTRRAVEKLEDIRRRKAELALGLQGNELAASEQSGRVTGTWAEPYAGDPSQAGDMSREQYIAAEPMAQSMSSAPNGDAANTASPAASSAPKPTDRNSAYRRPQSKAEQAQAAQEQQAQAEQPNQSEQASAARAYAATSANAARSALSSKPAAPSPSGAEPKHEPIPYVFPSIDLLSSREIKQTDTRLADTENAKKLEKTLESFAIPARVQRVTHGPAVTRFELGLVSSGVNVKRILSIADNIALDMAANGGVRIEIPIPGTNLFGIEVPNTEIQSVTLSEVLTSPEMRDAKSPLAVALGRDIAGRPIICDLAKMPHLLIAGQTGSGKSVCINSIINSLLFRSSPEEVRMIMIDPKVVELQCYNVVPHLLIPVVSDPHKAAGALAWAVAEMLDRYHRMQSRNAREISAYNAKLAPDEQKMPRIVIVIDELADLMLACKKEVEESIIRLAQLARAAGIHMVVATQRPTVDVITGLIKSNVPSRIAFAVSSNTDSRTILDEGGAEKLLGRGDMLYMPTGVKPPKRVQGCFLSDAETERVVDYIASHSHVEFDPNVIEAMESDGDVTNPLDSDDADEGVDERLREAIDMVITDGQASISMLQRRMKIGYARAGRLIDDMAARGIVSKSVGSKPREVLMSREEYEQIKQSLFGE